MPRIKSVRARIIALRRDRPFRKFIVNLENGDRILIERPENIAFDPTRNSRNSGLSIVTRKVQLFSSFDAVSSVVHADRGGTVSN